MKIRTRIVGYECTECGAQAKDLSEEPSQAKCMACEAGTLRPIREKISDPVDRVLEYMIGGIEVENDE